MQLPLPYRPHPLLRNGHIQTLLVGVVCGERPLYRARPIVVPTHDGESLVVHEELGPPLSRDAELVILVHGLGGDHRSPYLERLAPRLRATGFEVWRVDLRGCGSGVPLAWKPANAGCSDDLATVVAAAADRYPSKRMHMVGFSLSGNILLKMLGELENGTSVASACTNLASALAIAPPVNLHDCADNMDRLSRRLYCKYYLRVLEAQVQIRRDRWPQWQSLPPSPKLKTIRHFDAFYTAPLSGFGSAEEYYSKSSSIDLLNKIQVPTQILIDRDDPIVTASSIEEAELSDCVHVQTTRHGGHMGYFGLDSHGRLIRWLEYFVLHHLKRQRDAR